MSQGHSNSSSNEKGQSRAKKYGMVIDLDKCTGCGSCMVACMQENNQSRDPQIHWIRVLEMDKGGRIEAFFEKPHDPPPSPLASMGIYVFERDVLDEFLASNPQANDFGHDVVPGMLAGGYRLGAHYFTGEWCDIADVDAYYDAHRRFTNGNGGSYVAESAKVAADAALNESILLEGVTVGRRATLNRVIVEEGALGQLDDALAGEALVADVEVLALAIHDRAGGADDRVVVAGLAHDQHAARTQHAAAVGQEVHVVARVVQAALAEDGVERTSFEGQALGVGRHHTRPGHVLLADAQHVVTDVQAHRSRPHALEFGQEEARPATQVQDPAPPVQEHVVALVAGQRGPVRAARTGGGWSGTCRPVRQTAIC